MSLAVARMPGRRRLYGIATAGVLALLASSGCAEEPITGDEPPCFPPVYSVKPAVVKPGETVTVHAGDADCNPRYGQNALVQITLSDVRGEKVIMTTAPMNDAGGFTYQFEVPPQAAPGQASVEAYPYGVDWCDDTGRNNRVAHPSGLARTSCAVRTEPLTIGP